MQSLKGIPLHKLEELFVESGYARYRAQQVFRWIYQAKVSSFAEMTDLSLDFRKELAQRFYLPTIKVVNAQASEDGTMKYLVELPDGGRVESVFIPNDERNTLCVSTQVGCKMACTFCATGYMKFGRNLESWEILEQYLGNQFPAPVTNIVYMGMGEPFDNFDAVTDSLRIFQDPRGPKIGKRHITVSTVGITPKVEDFIRMNLGRLAISLHGTTEEQRASIMPINKRYPLAELLETCKKLPLKARERVTFEYVLLEGVNDSVEDAERLVKLMRGIPNKINLLAYNENPHIQFKRPKESTILVFQDILLRNGLTATYRRSRGRDISGACGQLCTENTLRTMRSPSSATQISV